MEVASFLLGRTGDNNRNAKNDTALHFFVTLDNVDIIKLLLEKGMPDDLTKRKIIPRYIFRLHVAIWKQVRLSYKDRLFSTTLLNVIIFH